MKYRKWEVPKRTPSKFEYEKTRVIEAIDEDIDTRVVVDYGDVRGIFLLAAVGVITKDGWDGRAD